MKKITLLEWTKDLPDSTKMGTREVADMFGYKNAANIGEASYAGRIPECDFKFATYGSRPSRQRLYWLLGSLRKLHAQQVENA